MITVLVSGMDDLTGKLEQVADRAHPVLLARMSALAIKLEAHITEDKLSGQVLKIRTGNLRRSIAHAIDDSPQKIVARVFSSGDVKYARIHEFGGQTKAHVIEPRKGKALAFMMGGQMIFRRRVNHPGSKMPERSFMRSSLEDMKQEIVDTLRGAMAQAIGGTT